MRYIIPDDRLQMQTNFGCLDEVIEGNNIVRVIDVFIDELDIKALGFTKSDPKVKGRKPYNPRDLLKLYIYGYLNQISSSRKLERETKRNLEVKWLLGNLSPDFKTIADFRKDNREQMKNIFKEFSYICRSAKLIDFQLTAIDGSFFSAVNHNNKNYSKNKIKKLMKRLDDQIEQYLDMIKRTDEQEFSTKYDLKEQLNRLQTKKQEYQAIQDQMKETGESQISITDPDSKMMVKSKSKTDVSYNVQSVVDSKHHLIIEYDVTNDCNDMKQLSRMSGIVKETYNLDSLAVTADKGYSSGEELAKCKAMNVETFTPFQDQRKGDKVGDFASHKFLYDQDNDCYTCPAGRTLPKLSIDRYHNQTFYGSPDVCKGCGHLSECTSAKLNFRKIYRSFYTDIVEEQKEKNRHNKDKLEARKMMVEHPFGTIKHHMKFTGFLTRRLPSVNGEFGLVALSYNIKRAFNILGFDNLIAAIQRYYCVKKSRNLQISALFYFFRSIIRFSEHRKVRIEVISTYKLVLS